MLQEDENSRSSDKGSRKKSSAELEALHLQEEELRRKIRENEELHRKIGEMKRESDREIRQLREQVQVCHSVLRLLLDSTRYWLTRPTRKI